MPELRLAKARATLPKGYQFGDAAPVYAEMWATATTYNSPVLLFKTTTDGKLAEQPFAPGLTLRAQGEWHGGN